MSFFSIIDYTGDGSVTDFVIPFSYILQTDIKVYVDDVLQTSSEYSFLVAFTIQFNTAPAIDAAVRIDRDTNISEVAVDFQDNSSITEADLDTAINQLFFIVQEAADRAASSLNIDTSNNFNAGGLRVIQVADPVEPNDAVNLGFLNLRYPDISLVAGAIDDVTAVSGALGNISLILPSLTDIETVADNIAQVVIVADNIAELLNLHTNLAALLNLNSNITSVTTVEASLAAINTIVANLASVNSVATNITSVNTAASNIGSINTVANRDSDIQTVANRDSDIGTVANAVPAINDFLAISAEIQITSQNIDDIETVANNISDINSLAGNIEETARDAVGLALANGTHSKITFTIDDAGDTISAEVEDNLSPKITLLTSGAGATFTQDSDTKEFDVEIWGAGGGGGGTNGNGSGTAAAARSGNGGGYSRKRYTNMSQTFTYSIGAGGGGGAAGANTGGTGGDTSFTGSVDGSITATGGDGGGGANGTSGNLSSLGFGVPGEGSGGDLNLQGSCASGRSIYGGKITESSTPGQAPYLSGGELPVVISGAAGAAAFNFGAGGTGALSEDISGNNSGGNGGDGLIMITEYKK